MTNFDLEQVYEFLSYVRYDPKNQKNIFYLDGFLDALDENDGDSSDFKKIFYSKEDSNHVRNTFVLIAEPYQKITIKDDSVRVFFRFYFLEIKHLCLTKRYNQVFYLIDMLDNFPEEIIKNELCLPIKKLKKCLKRYWRKYDKSFLRDFIRNNKRNSKF